MAEVRDIDRPGGWLVRVTTPGNSPIERYFKVYVLDQARAVRSVLITAGEMAEVVKQLNVHEFTGDNMRPGDVKQLG
jgi:hypothetical protein